jgi:hypothetical protein
MKNHAKFTTTQSLNDKARGYDGFPFKKRSSLLLKNENYLNKRFKIGLSLRPKTFFFSCCPVF